MLFPAATAADENVVSYELFFATNADVDDDIDSAAVTHAREQILSVAADFTRGFVWQCQRFHLSPPTRFSTSDNVNSADNPTAHAIALSSMTRLRRFMLQGATRVGDEIRDEWVVVALLVELSRTFPDALVRVRDSDGEFLLIECADALPEWAFPENCSGRVVLRNSELHLVPPSVVPEPSDAAQNQKQNQKQTQRRRRPKRQPHNHDSAALLHCLHAVLAQPPLTRANDAMQRALARKLQEVPRFMRESRHRVRCLLPARAAHVLARCCPEVLGAAVEAFYYREPTQAAAICARMDAFSPSTGPLTERMVAFSRCMFAQLKQQQFFAPKPFVRASGYQDALGPLDGAETGDASALAAEIGMKLACGLELLYALDGDDQFGQPWRRVIDDALASSSSSSSLTTVSTSDADDALLSDNDDDAWLHMHPDSLEEQLRDMEASMGARDSADDADGGAKELESIATMFNTFLGGVSGIDGVEGNEPIRFDMSAFMEALNGDGGGGDQHHAPPRFADGGEYFGDDDDGFGDDDSSGDDDDDDSDDEMDARMEAAMAEMDAELSTTHLAKSFARVDSSSEATGTPADDNDELDDEIAADKPLDLDFNLLSNLLESFASQDGHAGPVSNILGELSFPCAL